MDQLCSRVVKIEKNSELVCKISTSVSYGYFFFVFFNIVVRLHSSAGSLALYYSKKKLPDNIYSCHFRRILILHSFSLKSQVTLFRIKPKKKAIFGILKGDRAITLKKSKVPNILEMILRMLKTWNWIFWESVWAHQQFHSNLPSTWGV